jgi:NAD(P)-dependent dehydrogenase (short-subunit alcohol dehydrogenase family)
MASGGRFDGKHVLVTAAGSGIGRATARGFAAEGATTVALVERLPDRLDAVTADVESLGARAVPIDIDLRDDASAEHALSAAIEPMQRLDVLVSNHAVSSWVAPYLEVAPEEWETEVAVNLTSHHFLAQRAAREMAGTEGGVILFTASVAALGAGSGFAPYCVTKAGLVALSQVMAVELAPHRVRVNCVSPGPVDTQRYVDLVGEETMCGLRESFPGTPQNRLATAEDVAGAFLYLASDAAAHVTGQNLIVDGGLTAQAFAVPD